ncbi:hypothetical protein JCM1841_001310 [Sporobolomyces salmonicolor]
MPKSTKHKKARAADFTKAKLKLGKAKQLAANATDTSFSAKSIALPNQSLSETKKDVPTSRRNLSLPELLVQSRHYSVPVKKEALLEIQQLLTNYPYLLNQHLLPLIQSLAHLVADASASIRSATLALLRHVSSVLSTQSLVSVSQGLILFTLSALSSLDDGVRVDALRVLDLLLEKIPEEIVRGWDGSAEVYVEQGRNAEDQGTGAKVVEALLGMLKIRTPGLAAAQGAFTSAASSDLGPSARLAVLTTLATFLRTSLSPVASTSTAPPPWYLASSFSSPRAYATFLASFGSTSVASPFSIDINATRSAPVEAFSLAVDCLPSSFALSSLGLPIPPSTPVPPTSTSPATPAQSQSLLALLHPTLISSFLDAAPTAFSPTPVLGQSSSAASAELQTVSAVLLVARELFYRDLARAASPSAFSSEVADSPVPRHQIDKPRPPHARKLLLALLTHAAPYFPFGADELHARSPAEEQQLLQLNLTLAELVSLLILSGDDASPSSHHGAGGKKREKQALKAHEGEKKAELVVARVEDWVVGALTGALTSASHPLGLPPLSVEAYGALEPTLWALLNQRDKERARKVFEAGLVHFKKAGAGGAGESKRRAFEFIARAILIQSDPSYTNRFDAEEVAAAATESKLAQWLVSLPKYLWELGPKQPETTEVVLDLLLKLAQQGSKGIFPSALLSTVSPLLVPFFHLQHPSRGAMPGPFTKLPTSCQRKAVDLVTYLRRSGAEEGDKEGWRKLAEAVERAVRSRGVEEGIRRRWSTVGGW